MKFKNLGINILYRLDENHRFDYAGKLFSPKAVHRTFADIPAENVTDAIASLHEKGFLKIDSDNRNLSITSTGRTKIKALRRRLKIL